MKKEYKDSFLGFTSRKKDKLIGAYKLIHLESGKFYIGSTSNFYERRLRHIGELRKNIHYCQRLQELYNENPHFRFEFFFAGARERARKLAYDTEQMLLDDYANSDLLLNDSLGAELATRNKTLEARKKVSVAMKIIKGTPEFKAGQAEKARRYWQDPEYRKKKSRLISIDGVEYSSIKEATEKLKIHPFTIGHRLKNKKKEFDHYQYLD